MKRGNHRTPQKKRWPKILLSLAIALVAGVGFLTILGTFLIGDQPGSALQNSAEQTEVSAQMTPEPTLQPTPDPTPIPTPTPTPQPTLTPTPEPTPVPLPLGGLKIGIDAGHQRKQNSEQEPVSPGSKEKKAKVSSGTAGVSTKIPEYETNLQMSLILRDMLESYGAEVKMVRETNDVNISNVERATMMNEWGADLVLRIHCNGVDSKKTNGIGLYVRKTGTRADECYAAAEAILPRMLEKTGARKDGIFKRDVYSGLNWSEVPSILVENGYMSNPEEDKKLNDPAYQELLMEGVTQGVADYFERDLSSASPIPKVQPEITESADEELLDEELL